MKRVFCVPVLFTAIQSFSQSYETKLIEQPVILINCESYISISNFKKIESGTSTLFHIKTGNLIISISGIIDKASSSKITISLDAIGSLDNEMVIVASKDSQYVEYKVEGAGFGAYSGNFNIDDNYIINTRFKIVAPGHPSYVLVLPLNLRLSRTGNNNLTHCFIDGTAYIYNAGTKKTKKRNRKNIQAHQLSQILSKPSLNIRQSLIRS